jgi:hypothetical protein
MEKTNEERIKAFAEALQGLMAEHRVEMIPQYPQGILTLLEAMLQVKPSEEPTLAIKCLPLGEPLGEPSSETSEEG